MRYKQYDSLKALSRRQRRALKKLLFDDEEFVMGIDCKEGRVRSKNNQKLVLTTERVLAFEKGLTSTSSEDYALDSITSIQLDTGLRSAKIQLQGSAIDDTFPATKGGGRAFVQAVREQLAT
jgi:hypothetical protein